MEFGCGGTIARLIEEGTEPFVVVFSMINPGINPPGILREEFYQSMCTMGISKLQVVTYNWPMRNLLAHRQAILEKIINQRKRIEPDVVFIPSLKDMHQDHQVVANEGFRAFKDRTTLGYELPWNNLEFKTTHFIELQNRHVTRKVLAINQYRSQFPKIYTSSEYLWSLARTRGHQVGLQLAECFEVYRWIIPV
jgi:LmbE family N-acetylglucosaminyl deacetylase